MLNTWSKPAFRTLPIASVVRRTMVGTSPGMVMCHTRFQRLAPSIAAAS